ncbi:uncharacterized protein LOC143204505 [Rhynchophorus ferrugineus]|uniref:uncharacterized protein LOC143204505 n=1 Tax=Rhynchophorus ferrugineus TaxID=354439 RepID=UPI003FCD541D
MTKKKVDDVFFQLFCEKNSDGTKHLRLRGKELYQRFGYRLNPEDMPELSNFLKSHPEVTSVDLAYNDLGNFGMEILAKEYFVQENNMKYLNLLHCDLNAEGMKHLSEAACLRLEGIRLVGNKLGNEGARYIGKLIENCPTLEILDIGETDQTLESIECLLIVVEKSTLKSINISRIIPLSFYSGSNNSILADDLAVLLKLNSTLEILEVEKCQFDGHDVELLLGGLKWHPSLSMLNLSANRIGDHGAILLSQWLKTRPPLIALNISANAVGTRGAQALALTLPFSRIRLLDLHDNKIGDQGISEIIDSLKKPCQMRMFFIWGNVLESRSLYKLDRAVKAGVLQQDLIDVKVYITSDGPQMAYYPTNHYKHRFYSVMDHGYPPELKIVRNKVVGPDSQPRALVQLDFIDRYPPVDAKLGLKCEHESSSEQPVVEDKRNNKSTQNN